MPGQTRIRSPGLAASTAAWIEVNCAFGHWTLSSSTTIVAGCESMASDVDGPASATSASVTTSEVGSRSVGRKWSVAKGIPSDWVTGSTIDPTSVADTVAGESARAPVIAVLPGLIVSLFPFGLLPGVAATSTCASIWNTAW